MSWALAWREWKEIAAFKALLPNERRIVFFVEDGTSVAHVGPLIKELVGRGKKVCYLTSSADDPWLVKTPQGVKPFYIGDGIARTLLFAGLRARVMVMTMPDLETFHLKRSRNHAVKYVYVFHSMVSTHMIYRQHAFDNYDEIFCVGRHHVEEIRRAEKMGDLKPKKILEYGYGRLDELLRIKPTDLNEPQRIKRVLIAPSWGDHGLLETKGEEILQVLLQAGYEATLRPHPMTVRKHPHLIAHLQQRFGQHPGFVFGGDITTADAFFQNDIMISDFSGAALEYAFVRERPVVFIDVPRKINNPDYMNLGIEPIEVSIREQIGVTVGCDDIKNVPKYIERLDGDMAVFRKRIDEVRHQTVFNLGKSAACGADHLAKLIDDE